MTEPLGHAENLSLHPFRLICTDLSRGMFVERMKNGKSICWIVLFLPNTKSIQVMHQSRRRLQTPYDMMDVYCVNWASSFVLMLCVTKLCMVIGFDGSWLGTIAFHFNFAFHNVMWWEKGFRVVSATLHRIMRANDTMAMRSFSSSWVAYCDIESHRKKGLEK